uniref:Uncharacterized protein n=1 Tax=Arundo donax TaxID=35708 RepID=A0A0A9BMM8_ARUDO
MAVARELQGRRILKTTELKTELNEGPPHFLLGSPPTVPIPRQFQHEGARRSWVVGAETTNWGEA